MYTVRELSLRLILVWIVCILFTGFFAFIARAIRIETISSFDEPIIDFIQGAEAPWLTTIMRMFTDIGSTTAVIILGVITLGILLLKKYHTQAILFVVALAGTGILNQTLKFIFKRDRPDLNRLIDIGGYSFPSGHTMIAFSLYTIIAYIIWRNLKNTWSRVGIMLLAVFMIVMIAVSRIYLGVHFPSDIVGGFLASSVFLFVIITMYQRFQRQKPGITVQ